MTRIAVSALALLCSTVALTVAGCGAGAGADALRADAPTGADALGEGECLGVDEGGEPLIVDWKPEQRGDLEVAMKDGIAVVSYSCQGIKLLAECKIDGDYGYIGMTRREQVVRLQNADELKANLPLSGAALSGEIQRGTSLDIAMMIVGKKRTTWDVPTKDDLKGKCDGATHFVRGATVGAFAMGTGSDAKVRAAAEIFGFGADAGSSSAKQTQNRDGDIADCQKATPDSTSAPAQCGAPIRLVLAPIGKGAAAAAPPAAKAKEPIAISEKSECPKGMVFTEGKCTAKATAAAYECKPGDEDECKTQCDKGNAASCGMLGELHAKKNDYAGAGDPLKKGCDGGHTRSCANLGAIKANGLGGAKDEAAAMPLLQKACDAGDAVGCRELARATAGKDETKAAGLFRQGCDGGDIQACASLASMTESGKGVAKDPFRAGMLHRRACDGGVATSCASAGQALASGPMKNEILASMSFMRGCIMQNAASCTGLARLEFGKQPDAAKRHFQQACTLRDPVGCAAQKVLFNTPGNFLDINAQNQAADRCRQGSAYDCTTAALFDAAKGMNPPAKMNAQQACTRGDAFACELQKKIP